MLAQSYVGHVAARDVGSSMSAACSFAMACWPAGRCDRRLQGLYSKSLSARTVWPHNWSKGNGIGDPPMYLLYWCTKARISALTVARPDNQCNGPADNGCQDEADEAKGWPHNFAPAGIIGVADLDAQWKEEHGSCHHLKMQSASVPCTAPRRLW